MAEENKPQSNSNLSFLDNWAGCTKCGNTNDLGAYFSNHGLCMSCVRANHKKAMGR